MVEAWDYTPRPQCTATTAIHAFRELWLANDAENRVAISAYTAELCTRSVDTSI